MEVSSSSVAQKPKADQFALPGGWGGLAGAAIHQTSLGSPFFPFSAYRRKQLTLQLAQ